MAKGLDVAFQGWDKESLIGCMSHSATSKKGQHAAVMDLRVGGFLRLLQVGSTAQILRKFLGGNIHVRIERGNMGIERCSKKAVLDTFM